MSSKHLAVVLQGVKSVDQVPGLEAAGRDVEWRCAPTADDLSEMLPGAEVLLGWDFRASELRAAWGQADRLRWIQWSGAGVDAAGTLLTQSFDLASVDRHSDTSASAGRKISTADKQPPGARMTHP